MSSGGNSSRDGNRDEEGWGSKFMKVASAAAATAAVAGGLYALLSSASSSSNNNRDSETYAPFESHAGRVTNEPQENQNPWALTPSPRDSITYRFESGAGRATNEPQENQNPWWTKPEPDWVKLNVDGSQDHCGVPNTSGCGGVFRDSSGTWLYGFAQKLEATCGIHEAEIRAVLKGLELGRKRNYKKLVVESDREPVVNLVKNGCKANHPHVALIKQIMELRDDSSWEVQVVFVRTVANRVADKLANYARGLSPNQLLTYDNPPTYCIPSLSN